MAIKKSHTQWQKLFKLYDVFSGDNRDFCKQQSISLSSFYKYKALLTSKQTDFVQIKAITSQPQRTVSNHITLKNNAGLWSFPSQLSSSQLVAIIKGLSS